MSTNIDLGRIKFKWNGPWSNTYQYVKDDVVSHNGNAWVALRANQGVEPTGSSTDDWEVMVQGSALGTISGLGAGDLFYYDGTGFERVAAGSDNEVLMMSNGVPGFGELNQGRVIRQIFSHTDSSNRSSGSSWTVGMTTNAIPVQAQSDFLVYLYVPMRNDDSGWGGGYNRLEFRYRVGTGAWSGYYQLGQSGYSTVMNSNGADIGEYSNWFWIPLGLSGDGEIQLRHQFRSYSSTVTINQSNSLSAGDAIGGVDRYQNYSKFLMVELSRTT